jgi:RND family efflux transporter MFP subunit
VAVKYWGAAVSIGYNPAHAFVFDSHVAESRVPTPTTPIRWQPIDQSRPSIDWAACALSLIVVLTISGCHPDASIATTPPTIVTVAEPLEREVTDAVYFIGRTDGSEYVEVRARVSGYLTEVLFHPGTRIKQGDPLFEIDARPYRVALDQAEAELERAKARETRTVADLSRNEKLVSTGAISKETFDQFVGNQAEAAATVKSAAAAVERAKLDLSWTKIFAPIGGLVSREQLTVGNLVTADQTRLTTILRDDPMYVYFDIDEKTVLRILQLIREGKFKSARENKVAIRMALGNETDYSLEGHVNFVENRVDPSSGTMRIRGEFVNPRMANGSVRLTAGLFGRVRFELGSSYDALLVTERAIQSDQDQKFVYVVNSKNEVERREIMLGKLDAGLRVVQQGLKPGDRVIINGVQRVRPGSTVDAKLVPMPESPQFSAADQPLSNAVPPKETMPSGDAAEPTDPGASTPR